MARAVLVPYAPSSVTSARQRLCTELADGGLEAPCVNDAALVLSELLSNALRHASPLPPPFPPESVQVGWDVEAASSGRVRLEIRVRDGGAPTLPRIARPSPSALGGRGLGIVEHLAHRWGTEVDGAVTTVWAVLELGEPQAGDGDAGAAAAFVSSRTRVMSG